MLALIALLGATVGLGLAGPRDEAVAGGPTSFNQLYDSYPASVSGNYQPIAGDFDCDGSRREILWYAAGPAPDYIWKITGTAGGTLQYTSEPLTIKGTYQPFIISYDGAGNCGWDIFWYAPGPAPDYIWNFDTPGDFAYESVRTSVTGTYTPVVTEIGSGVGIYWYAPGSATDHIWLLDQMGGITQSGAPQVSGTYRPVPARATMGTGVGILWYGRGTSPDHFWDQISPTNAQPGRNFPVTINGYYEPHPLGADVLLYGRGSAPDYLITEISGLTGAIRTLPGSVSGTYRVATPIQDDMIVWHAPGPARDYVWLER